MCVCVPEVLQALVLAQLSVQFSHLQAQQAQQDVQPMGLLSGLGEAHDVVLEGPGQQGCGHTHTHTQCEHCSGGGGPTPGL